MDDRQLLDLLAEEAPVAQGDFPGRMVETGRRARRRRRVLAGSASLAGVLVCVAAVGAVVDGGAVHRLAASRPSAPADSVAGLYAASVRALADQMRSGSSRSWKVLYVADHFCRDLLKGPDARPCDLAPLSQRLRGDLSAALRPYAPVVFVSDPASVTAGKIPQVIDSGLLIKLGPALVSGSSARVTLSAWRNLQSSQGLTYRLSERNGTWTVSGPTGGGWIS